VGTDIKTIEDVLSFGAKHKETAQGEVVADKEHLIFTTPCYMLPATIKDIALCADNLIKSMLESM
jgi:enhancing lycopene biosynthesis protein 2